MNYVLSIDVGTTAFKAGVFTNQLELIKETSCFYNPCVYDHGKADTEPEIWWQALLSAAKELRP